MPETFWSCPARHFRLQLNRNDCTVWYSREGGRGKHDPRICAGAAQGQETSRRCVVDRFLERLQAGPHYTTLGSGARRRKTNCIVEFVVGAQFGTQRKPKNIIRIDVLLSGRQEVGNSKVWDELGARVRFSVLGTDARVVNEDWRIRSKTSILDIIGTKWEIVTHDGRRLRFIKDRVPLSHFYRRVFVSK